MKDKKLIGIFENEDQVIRVINNLKEEGYKDNEISVIAKKTEKLDRVDDVTKADTKDTDSFSKTAGGAAIGGALGGIASLLAGLGVFAIPGIGPFVAAGPIATTLTGLLAGGTLGGVTGALVELGIDEDVAKEYEEYLNKGDILVAVDEKENVKSKDILVYYAVNHSIIRDGYGVDGSPHF